MMKSMITMLVVVACWPFARLTAQVHAPGAASQPVALGKVAGACTFDKTHEVRFVDGVALPGFSSFDSKEPVTRVYVADFPLGAFRPDLRVSPEDDLLDLRGKRDSYSLITLEISRKGALVALGPSGSSRVGFTYTDGRVANGRIAGKVDGSGGARGEDTCQITFDVPVDGDYGAGKLLPSDGGEPGNAMRAFWASLEDDENTAATLAQLGESWVASAKQGGGMPQFVTVFGSGRGDHVTGGVLYGTGRAILDIDTAIGTKARALLLKQGEQWRVQDVSFD